MRTPGEIIREKRETLGLSQAQLAKQSGGISQATVEKIEKGETLRSKFLPAIAKRLGLDLEQLDPTLANLSGEPTDASNSPAPPILTPERDFPVYASAEGGVGEILRSTDPIDFIPRPAPVAHVREAYGLVITGTSMIPEFRPGETALVNPKLPMIAGEVYVFYSELHGEARATIKQLTRMTATDWHVCQHNPPPRKAADFTLTRKEWRWAHRVFGKHTRQ